MSAAERLNGTHVPMGVQARPPVRDERQRRIVAAMLDMMGPLGEISREEAAVLAYHMLSSAFDTLTRAERWVSRPEDHSRNRRFWLERLNEFITAIDTDCKWFQSANYWWWVSPLEIDDREAEALSLEYVRRATPILDSLEATCWKVHKAPRPPKGLHMHEVI